MSAVTDISSIAPVDCPRVLRDIPGWLIWRFEPNDNPGGKPRKVPYYATGGRRDGEQGGREDRDHLATFDAARAAAARRGFDGVGFATLPDFDIVALDFDDCVADGQVHPEVLALLDCTYAELSPSRQGIRAFFKGQLGNRKSHHTRNKTRVHDYGFETFSSRGYVTFTGDVLDIVELMGNADEVAPLSPAVFDLVGRRFKRELQALEADGTHNDDAVGLTPSEVTRALAAIDPNGLPYEDTDGASWMGVGMALHHETGGSADGFEQWDTWASASDKYTSRDYGAERWRSMGRYTGGASITARSLVKWANELGADIALGGPASAEDFDAVEPPSAEQQAKKPMRFQVVPAAEFAARPPPQWIVKGVVPQAELMVIYGESTAGKTFVALDLAAAIARGVPWRGRKVKQRRVVYVCAEGQGGFQMRLRGYAPGRASPSARCPWGSSPTRPTCC
jgi:hypothetical protein